MPRTALTAKAALPRQVYTAKVRIIVRAGPTKIMREGTGTGYGQYPSPGVAHDLAIKATETDATKDSGRIYRLDDALCC